MSLHRSIRSWLQDIEAHDQDSCLVTPIDVAVDVAPSAPGKRKRDVEQASCPRRSQRIKVLGEISGNASRNMKDRVSKAKTGSNERSQANSAAKKATQIGTRRSIRAQLASSQSQYLDPPPERRDNEDMAMSDVDAPRDEADEVGNDNVGDLTPRPLVTNPAFQLIPVRSDTSESSAPSSPSRTSTIDASSTRSQSPIKNKIDLALAKIPTRYFRLDGFIAERLGGVLSRYRRLADISQGYQIIPLPLRKAIDPLIHVYDRPKPSHYFSHPASLPTHAYMRDWPSQFHELVIQASKCEIESHGEAAWNDLVHSKVLQMVLSNPRYKGRLDSFNITSAQIQPKSIAPKHRSGHRMQSKLVDFAVCLQLGSAEEERVLQVLARLPENAQSVNQTLYAPLRHRPIAFNIETKTAFSGGETADVQMSVWAGAGLIKLSQIMAIQGKSGLIPVMPTLTFYGHDLYMSTIAAEEHRNVVHSQLFLGSTRTMVGMFQLTAALDVLADWANTEYRGWLESVFV